MGTQFQNKSRKKTHVLIVSEYFPSDHFRAGEPTNFPINISAYIKKHTLRYNYEYWKKRIDEVKAGIAILSIRIWVGKPYGKGSSQLEILALDYADIQKIELAPNDIFIDGKPSMISYDELAKNDGLTKKELFSWFPVFPDEPMALIHFTDFKYGD